jgi:hypothetical protein
LNKYDNQEAAKGVVVKKEEVSTLKNSSVATKLDGKGHSLRVSPHQPETSNPPRKSLSVKRIKCKDNSEIIIGSFG